MSEVNSKPVTHKTLKSVFLLNAENLILAGGGFSFNTIHIREKEVFLMGRKNKFYSKTLHQQAYDKLTSMQAFGESKQEAMKDGTYKDKIFSFDTYKGYWKHIKYFIKYVQEQYPKCTTMKSAKKYVNEWLQKREAENLSASTLHLEAKALGKLYGINPDDEDYYQPPKRRREDVKRSRGTAVRDKHFSEKNNDELIKFCKGTGLRRCELSAIKGCDIITKTEIEAEIAQLEQIPESERTAAVEKRIGILKDTRYFEEKYYIHIRKGIGKGGRERYSPIIGENQKQIVERMKNTPEDKKVWQHIHGGADIHNYRAVYATKIYTDHARKIEDIPYDRINKGTGRRYQSGVYTCRKDEAKRKLDRAAMAMCSKALGHNRPSIFADSYLRGV